MSRGLLPHWNSKEGDIAAGEGRINHLQQVQQSFNANSRRRKKETQKYQHSDSEKKSQRCQVAQITNLYLGLPYLNYRNHRPRDNLQEEEEGTQIRVIANFSLETMRIIRGG